MTGIATFSVRTPKWTKICSFIVEHGPNYILFVKAHLMVRSAVPLAHQFATCLVVRSGSMRSHLSWFASSLPRLGSDLAREASGAYGDRHNCTDVVQ